MTNFGLKGCLTVAGTHIYVSAVDEGLLVFDTYDPAPGIRLNTLRAPNPNSLLLRLTGISGQTARVQRSTDLRSWADWQTITFSQQPVELTEDTISVAPQQFYRAIVLP